MISYNFQKFLNSKTNLIVLQESFQNGQTSLNFSVLKVIKKRLLSDRVFPDKSFIEHIF